MSVVSYPLPGADYESRYHVGRHVANLQVTNTYEGSFRRMLPVRLLTLSFIRDKREAVQASFEIDIRVTFFRIFML